MIAYRNSSNREIQFSFENEDKSWMVYECLKKKVAVEIVKVSVLRFTYKIDNVELPATCVIDPWAFHWPGQAFFPKIIPPFDTMA